MPEAIDNTAVIIHGPCYGVLDTRCEMVDTADPETKIFRFKEGCRWLSDVERKQPGSKPVRKIHVFSYWPAPEDTLDPVKGIPGTCVARYRVIAELDPPTGFVAVLKGTTRPMPTAPAEATVNVEDAKCEAAILKALQAEPRMNMRSLKRKCHADRFGSDVWEKCIKQLTEAAEIKIRAEQFGRIWVELSPSPDALSPKDDARNGDTQHAEE